MSAGGEKISRHVGTFGAEVSEKKRPLRASSRFDGDRVGYQGLFVTATAMAAAVTPAIVPTAVPAFVSAFVGVAVSTFVGVPTPA